MISPISLIGYGFIGILTVIGGTGIIYANTRETIYDHVYHRVIGNDEEFDDSWQYKFSNIKGEINNIKTKEDLKKWCNESYERTYKSMWQFNDEYLLTKVEKHCIQTIEEKMGDSLAKSTDTDRHKENYKKLKNYNGELPKALKSIKDSLKDNPEDNDVKGLKDWCSSTSKKPYKGKEDKTFKLVETFCKKP